jgi:site-specific recombinase XerD
VGTNRLKEVKPIAVETWLDGMQVAPGTKAKTKGVMSVLFQHAMRYEWATTNPIRLVRQSAMPLQEEIVLTPIEIAALLSELRGSVLYPDPPCVCHEITSTRIVRRQVG